MCTVSINIDEATIRQIDPGLTSRESIGQWLQRHVDMMLKEIINGRAESRRQALQKDMTPEQLYSLISEEIDEIYANDFNLNIPRYVDTSEKEQEIDIIQVSEDIKDIKRKIADTESELRDYFKDLGIAYPF